MGCSNSIASSKGNFIHGRQGSINRSCGVSPDIPSIKIEHDVDLKMKEQFKIPLTDKEVLAVTHSWKTVKNNLTCTGMNMFLRMFKSREDVKEAFEQFRTLDNDVDMWESRTLETHGVVVMSAIDDIIINLDDEDCVINLILDQGRSHVRFGDFTASMFWAIEKPFLKAVEETLGELYTKELAVAYQKTIRYIIKTVVTGFERGVRENFGPYGKLS